MNFKKKRTRTYLFVYRRAPSPRPLPQTGGEGKGEGERSHVKRQTASVLVTSLIAVLMLCTGCLSIPETELLPGAPEDLETCFVLFPSGPWECVHKIEAVIQEGMSSSLLGITKGDPAGRKLHTLLLTPEGFILFEAEQHEDAISVLKAMAPFDSPAFARGLMEDVNLLFFPPQGRPSKLGKRADGALVCRWERPDGSRREIALSTVPKILLRDRHGDLAKEALLTPPFVNGLASQIELLTFKPAPYRLKMNLLSGTP